jgi:hypothetical protein
MTEEMKAASRKRKIDLKAEEDGNDTRHASWPETLEKMVEDDPLFHRITVREDASSGHVVALSSRLQRDADRWEADQMPSLSTFPELQRLELYDSRYITSLHASVTGLKHLRELRLVGCGALKFIPPMIDQLTQLEEVSKRD